MTPKQNKKDNNKITCEIGWFVHCRLAFGCLPICQKHYMREYPSRRVEDDLNSDGGRWFVMVRGKTNQSLSARLENGRIQSCLCKIAISIYSYMWTSTFLLLYTKYICLANCKYCIRAIYKYNNHKFYCYQPNKTVTA